jgi:hypothetical protein
MLMHPDSRWTVVTLTRKSDPDRAPKFYKAVERFNARGVMGDLDDSPEQKPLRSVDVQDAIMDLLPSDRLDLVLTHGPWGEYTRHKRHEEVSKAVVALRESESSAEKSGCPPMTQGRQTPSPAADGCRCIRPAAAGHLEGEAPDHHRGVRLCPGQLRGPGHAKGRGLLGAGKEEIAPRIELRISHARRAVRDV